MRADAAAQEEKAYYYDRMSCKHVSAWVCLHTLLQQALAAASTNAADSGAQRCCCMK
jgi:hypothetical protein